MNVILIVMMVIFDINRRRYVHIMQVYYQVYQLFLNSTNSILDKYIQAF